MPNLILKTGTTAISGAVVKGSFSYFSASTRDLGPTSVTGLYNGFNPPNGGFTVYYTGANTPAGWTCRIASDTSALNTLLISLGGTGSTVAQNIIWANNTNSVLVDSGQTLSNLVSSRQNVSYALENGVAYAWGRSLGGAIGDNSTTQRNTPVLVCGGLTFTSIAGGFASHSLGITNTGVAYAWGANSSGGLGDNSVTSRLTPVLVCGGLTFTSIAAGAFYSLGITNTGVAYGWGSNSTGQLGDGSTASRLTPVLVCGGLTFTSIAAGQEFSLGITNTGAAYGWGLNLYGQLGDNSTTSRLTPVLVCGVCGGLTFTSISAGASHSLGITNTGVAYAWGRNASGGLGDNSTTQRNTPVLVCGGLTFSSIAAGTLFSVGATNTQLVYAWGVNNVGQLGNNNAPNGSLTPIQVCVL